MPGDQVGDFAVKIPGVDEKESMVMRRMIFGDHLPETLNMDMVEGRFFSKNFNDSLSIVLNQSAVSKLGLTEPLGKKIIEVAANNDPVEFTIIGVINDFHFQSFHLDLKPTAFTSMEGPANFIGKMAIKVGEQNLNESLSQISEVWSTFVPGVPFRSYFLDTDMNNFYENEQATGRIFGVFTGLAILIACIGLLGLSAFIINQRVKEIGVRKVMGASVTQIIALLSRDFTKLVGIAAIIAIPISYFWMRAWLENFAYAAKLNWAIFLVAAVVALLIAVATVSFQSVKAATANPVKSLRDE